MPKYFMGIDISTTASKVLVVDAMGRVVASKSEENFVSNPYPQWSEQEPEQWWQTTCKALHAVLKEIAPQEIACVGLTGQMHGLVTLDKQGEVIRPAILWNDQRSYLQCEEITQQLGEEYLYQHIGGALIPCFITPKLRWSKLNEPSAYQKIAHILLPKDYIRLRLSGEYITDVADGSGLGLMDLAKRNWSDEILTALQIPREWLPQLSESTEIGCVVNEAGARATGLLPGTPIVAGAGDQPAQSVGCGIAETNSVSMAVGTSGVIFTVTDRYYPEAQGRLNTFCHAIPSTWFYMGVTMSAAGSMQWLQRKLASRHSYAELDELAANSPCGSQGLIFTPYLSGERHPYADPLARASFVGLTVRHGLPHMARAVMEGVAFSLRDVLELFYQQGINPTTAVISGGAANSALWRQIIADITGLPLVMVNSNEGAAFGAAILAAVGCKSYATIADACKNMITKVDAEQPITENVEQYNKIYPIYHNLYLQLKDTCKKLADVDLNF